MNMPQRVGVIVLCVGMATAMILPPILRAAAPAASATGKRSMSALKSELVETDKKYGELMPALVMIADPEFRKKTGPEIIPVLKKMGSLFHELEGLDPETAKELNVKAYSMRLLAYRYVFGDDEARQELEKRSQAKADDKLAASAYLNLGRWLLATNDAAAQSKILDEMAALAKDNGKDDDMARSLNYMANMGAANNDLTKKTIEVIRANITADGIKEALTELDAQQAMIALVGKPLAFEGRTSTGSSFKLSDYKGKVVMLDFWATWCGPCIGELPNVKAAYKDYHEKGFEIVGLSCDEGDAVLNDFTKKEGMPWVQLREKVQDGEDRWHPLAKKYGVLGIPTMFLVDRNGVVRYVDARENLEKKIAELVKEEPKP